MQDRVILVIDSGVGGLSIFRHLIPIFPHACLHYFADSAHAPYGDKSDQWVCERVLHIVAQHQPENLLALVLASNTLTAAAASRLRATYPRLPIIGVEPGLKPALSRTSNQRIGVLATQLTTQSLKFQTLLNHVKILSPKVQWVVQACPGLVECIESPDWDHAQIARVLDEFCAPLRFNEVDTVILGCTHYPFVEDQICAHLPAQTQIVDTGLAVATQVQRLVGHLVENSVENSAGHSADTPMQSRDDASPSSLLRLTTTGNAEVFMRLFKRLIGGDAHIQSHNY